MNSLPDIVWECAVSHADLHTLARLVSTSKDLNSICEAERVKRRFRGTIPNSSPSKKELACYLAAWCPDGRLAVLIRGKEPVVKVYSLDKKEPDCEFSIPCSILSWGYFCVMKDGTIVMLAQDNVHPEEMWVIEGFKTLRLVPGLPRISRLAACTRHNKLYAYTGGELKEVNIRTGNMEGGLDIFHHERQTTMKQAVFHGFTCGANGEFIVIYYDQKDPVSVFHIFSHDGTFIHELAFQNDQKAICYHATIDGLGNMYMVESSGVVRMVDKNGKEICKDTAVISRRSSYVTVGPHGLILNSNQMDAIVI